MYRFVTAVIGALLVLAVFAGCSGNTTGPAAPTGGRTSAQVIGLAPVEPVLRREVLQQEADELRLQAAAEPDALQQQLLSALADSLACRASPKAPRALPDGQQNVLNVTLSPAEGAGYVLRWVYKNAGDYDHNGEVNVADLSTVGKFIHAKAADPDWATAQPADGDDNGEVNVADVTPIGQHFKAEVAGYRVYWSDAADGPWTEQGNLTLAQADSAQMPASFQFALPSIDHPWYLVAPYDLHGDDPVVLGVSVDGSAYINAAPTAALTANRAAGMQELINVTFDASGSTDPEGTPLIYSWDFDGNGTFGDLDSDGNLPDPTSPSAHFVYGASGGYQAAVQVTDNPSAGEPKSSIATATITVDDQSQLDLASDKIPENHAPVCVWWFVNAQMVQTTSGPADQQLYVNFDDSYDPDDGNIHCAGIGHVWVDVNDDGTWETSTDVQPGPTHTLGPYSSSNDFKIRVKVESSDRDYQWENIGDARWYIVTGDPPKPPEPWPGVEGTNWAQDIDWAWNNDKSFGVGAPWNWWEHLGEVTVADVSIPVGYVRTMSHHDCIKFGIAAHYAYQLGFTDDPELDLKFLAVSQKHNPAAREEIMAAGDQAVDYAVAKYGQGNPMDWYLYFEEFLVTGGLGNVLREWGVL